MRTVLRVAALLALAAPAAADEFNWLRINPVKADGAAKVKDAGGGIHPSTGPKACDWFLFGGAGRWKEFSLRGPLGKTPILIHAVGDSGLRCLLGHLSFEIRELDAAGKLVRTTKYEGPDWNGCAPPDDPCERMVYHVPKTGCVRIAATRGGFYLTMYRGINRTDTKGVDAKTRAKAEGLIVKLADRVYRVRESSQRELLAMGIEILPILEGAKDSKDRERRWRVRYVLGQLRILRPSLAIRAEVMQIRVDKLVWELLDYGRDRRKLKDPEPWRSIGRLGPLARPELERAMTKRGDKDAEKLLKALGK